MELREWPNYVIEREIKALQNIPGNDYIGAVNLIYRHVHYKYQNSNTKLQILNTKYQIPTEEGNGKVICSGMGKAGQVAHNIATTLSSTGTPAIFLHPGEAQHGDMGVVQKQDVLLLVSNSGFTKEVIEMKDLADKMLGKKVDTILITGKDNSELSIKSNVVLRTGDPEEVCPLKLTPTTSMTTMMVIGDVLVCMMMELIGFTREEYFKRHHGGYLGSLNSIPKNRD